MILLRQSDFKEEENIRAAGCLMISLLTLAQLIVKKALTKEEILFMYKHLIKEGHMQDGKDRSSKDLRKKSCYVLNHSAIINEGLSFLIEPNIRASYVGCQYLDPSLGNSWGTFEGDYVILHIRALRGFGHFRLIDFDPSEPKVKYSKILSIRYYKVKEI